MTELPPYLSAGNARATVAACFADAGFSDAVFAIAEGAGSVTITVDAGSASVNALVEVKRRIQPLIHIGVGFEIGFGLVDRDKVAP